MELTNEESFEDAGDYKDLLDNSHDLIHLVDLTGNVLYINKSWIESSGYQPSDIIGKSIYSIINEKDRDIFINYRDKIIKGDKEQQPVTIGMKTKADDIIMLEGVVSLRKKNGQPSYTRGIFRNVTLEKENEARLKEREYNMQQLLINAPDAVIVIDSESKINFWNPKAEMIFGWTHEEVAGSFLYDKIIPEKYREAHKNGMSRYLLTGEANVLNKTIEITAVNKAGNEFNISLTISNTTQKGSPVFIAFLRDISEQKKNEAELENRRRQLEISNEQLQQFAHVASHDMKEPVRKIMIFSERLESLYGNNIEMQGQELLKKIHVSAERLKNIIDGFLNYATINSIQQAYQLIDLNAIIKNIEADLELVIKEKQATLIYGDFPAFKAVPFLIYQLFYNLIYNSLKFSKEDVPPYIEMSGRTKKDELHNDAMPKNENGFAEIIVKDNGIGFSEENAAKIFKTFVRLNSLNEYEGNGLGLTLCKNITERHQGFITAEGVPGSGATFTILLPLG